MALFVAMIVSTGFSKPVAVIKPEVNFEVPTNVLQLTVLDSRALPAEVTQPRWPTYAAMKGQIDEKVKNAFGLNLFNYSSHQALIVINGKAAHFVRGGRQAGLYVMSSRQQAPIPYRWFEEYGDTLVIGMFELEQGNQISRGKVFVVCFADLIDSQGNLRAPPIGLDVGVPLASIRPNYIKPRYDDHRLAPVVALKAGAKKLEVPKGPLPNLGPVVAMETFSVKENRILDNGWLTYSQAYDADGKPLGVKVEGIATNAWPLAEAGLQVGMIITGSRILDSDPGMVPVTKNAWTGGDLVLRIVDNPTAEPKFILVPASRIRKAFAAKGETVAAITP